ncbi:MAG TPA: hypothetical protein VKB05_07795 [Pyrinomonadaceae bacterium]|nr:hypothetical protein [Pyrinomonadaceae bacterium]
MKKISRRDYMLQMGAGALGIMGAARLDILAESRRNQQTTNLLWNTTPTFPSNSRVTAIFGGLFGFFYNTNTRNCEIGDHKGGGRHRLTIDVWERRNSRCKLLFSTEDDTLPRPKDPKIEIVGRAASEAKFYEVGEYNRATLNPQDFRWLLDLDSNDFYPDNHPKLNGQFTNKVLVRHGTFYTQQRTNSTFRRIDPPDSSTPNTFDLFQVANYVAAGIEPNQNEDVVFKVNDNSAVVFTNKPGFTYQIVFLNECYNDGHQPCPFDPGHANEANRNDFHFMRKMLQLPANAKVYGLKLKDEGESRPNFCSRDPHRLTDEAPCMGTAFGQTNGMP